MFCTGCGKKLNDGAKFCPYCGQRAGGAPSPEAAAAEAPGPVAPLAEAPIIKAPLPEAPIPEASGGPVLSASSGRKGRRGLGLIAGIAAAAAVFCVVAAVAVGGLLGGPKAKIAGAAQKSLQAYAGAADAAGFSDFKILREQKAAGQSLSLELTRLSGDEFGSGAEMLEGFGLEGTMAFDLPGREMGASLAVRYDSSELAAAYLTAKDSAVTACCPALLGASAYGVNTETLGRELSRLGVEDGSVDVEAIGFNLFDVLDTFLKPLELDKAAWKDLVKAIEAEKAGKAEIEVNGSGVSCTEYHVTVPEDAMRDFLSAVKDAVKARDMDGAVADLLRSLGVPEEELSYVRSRFKDGSGEVFSTLKDAIKDLGDLELAVYISGGRVSAVVWEGRVEGTKAEIGAYFGGGKRYVDDLGLEVRAMGETMRLESSGDHAAKSGTFSDSTVLYYGGTRFAESEIEFEPKKSGENFAWEIQGDGLSMELNGSLAVKKDSLALTGGELTVDAYGSELFAAEGSYRVGPYERLKTPAEKTVLLESMDPDDLEDLAYEVRDNAGDWAGDLASALPWLSWYLF